MTDMARFACETFFPILLFGATGFRFARPTHGVLRPVSRFISLLVSVGPAFSDRWTVQCINSIDRAVLNESLLATCAATANVRVFFQHKVQSIDFDGRTMSIRDVDGGRDVDVTFNLCVGADGSYSVVRRQLMRVVR